MSDVILEAIDLVRHFEVGSSLFRKGKRVRAVDGVSLQVARGETFAIVGESGCGKSTLARLLMRLDKPTAGKVLFEERETHGLKGRELTELRRDLQFIFQDPFSSLNPRITVGKLVGEPIEVHAPDLAPMPVAKRWRNCWLRSVCCLNTPTATRMNFPVVSASGSALPERWPPAHGSLSEMSRFPHLMYLFRLR